MVLDVKAHWSALLLLAARNSTPYSRALREQQQCTKQRSIVPNDPWGHQLPLLQNQLPSKPPTERGPGGFQLRLLLTFQPSIRKVVRVSRLRFIGALVPLHPMLAPALFGGVHPLPAKLFHEHVLAEIGHSGFQIEPLYGKRFWVLNGS